MPLATTWMELEGIMLSEISQINTNIVWYHLYMESKKKKEIHINREKLAIARGENGAWEIG